MDGGEWNVLGERRNAYRIFVWKLRRPLGRPRHRWKDNTAINFQEIRRGAADLIHLAQDTDKWQDLVNTIVNLQIP